ncbi:MAG: Do family serine endopeptidase [Alphaproteobacteria bacterium]|nr:Do family serine endopeptidase [Alphaproteobacteria bacterium]MBU6472060.1 Do family serine endopeptidase [Alphaproteobacteria bacterium]
MTEHPDTPRTMKSRLLAAAAAGAIIMVGLGAFALLPHPGAEPAGPAPAVTQVADRQATPPRMVESGAPFSFADLVERVAPAVVTVTVEEKPQTPQMTDQDVPAPFRDFFHQFGMPQMQVPRHAVAMGSGFIIDKSGYIVTNNHVVTDATKITIKLKDGRQYTARLIGTDPATDIALLKIDADKPLPTVEFANDRNVRVGDWVIAVGNPFGLSNTVTAGIVSSIGRNVGNGAYTDYLQIDAPINRGNSGGPTFDIEGKVIGMNTMIYSPSGGSVGIGFAIPSSTIHDVVAQLKAHGKVTRGWLGVEIQDLTPEMASSLGNKNMKGAIVAKVVPDSPASKAGFQQGDIVVAVNGQPVSDSRDLTRRVATLPTNANAGFSIVRDGKAQMLSARIALRTSQDVASAGSATPGAGNNATGEAMGLGLSAITPDLRHTYNLDNNVNGVVITKVNPDSDAADKGVQPGDVVMSVGNQAVRSPADIQRRIAQAKSEGRDSVLVLLNSQEGERFVALKVGKS